MNGSKYDVLTTCHEKDFNKLKYWYEGIQNITDFEGDVFIITNVKIPKKDKITNVNYLVDDDILDFSWDMFEGNIKRRTGWYKQQFIKLFQNVTSDNYLVVDSDSYIISPLKIIVEHPCFFFGDNQYHPAYFEFINEVFNWPKKFQYSFINEIMFFKRNYIESMLLLSGEDNKYNFFNKAVKVLNKINHVTSSFSEYETYGNFIYNFLSDSYNYIFLKTKSYGLTRQFTEVEIRGILNKSSNYDKISLHTWT